MQTFDLFKKLSVWLLGACLCMGSASVYAVHDINIFELEGDAIEDAPTPPEDWETLYDGGNNTGGSSDAFTGILGDPAPETIFTQGGSKDIYDIPNWRHTSGSVPDKDDITNAFAAAYNDGGDLIVYFGADRFANDGDAQMGFWFFENEVTLNPDGTFNGVHGDDILVIVHWAAGSAPDILVLEWNPAECPKKTPGPEDALMVGDCAGNNLKILVKDQAECNGGPDDYCAIANTGGESAPWPYEPKQGVSGIYPELSFFEGGINLSEVLGADSCFSSFLAETRSSTSASAQLKDFRLGGFPVCGIEVTKVCTNPQLNEAETHVTYDVSGLVTNTGFGTVFDVTILEIADGLSFDNPVMIDSVAAGVPEAWAGTITVPVATSQSAFANQVSATAFTQDGQLGTALSAESEVVNCPPLTIEPAIDVTKACESSVEVLALGAGGFGVVAQVSVSGEVCNIGDTGLSDVTVTDDKAGTLLSGVSLASGDCMNYSGSYTPDEAFNSDGVETTDPSAVMFSDTVTAEANDLFGAPVTPAEMEATCPLCP